MKNPIANEMYNIKNKLVDTSLVVISIIGLPLVASSVAREVMFKQTSFWYIYASIYCLMVIITLFRHRITYNVKALAIIVNIYLLGFTDLIEVGFIGVSFLWLTTAIIVTALFFNFRASIITLTLSLTLLTLVYIFHKNEILVIEQLPTDERFPIIAIQTYTLIMILLGLMIPFSYNHIQKSLEKNYSSIIEKNETLSKLTSDLQLEIETRIKSELIAINNEKNFRNIFDKNSDPIIVINKDGTIIDYNEAFKSFTGLSDFEIKTINPVQIFSVKGENQFDEFLNNYERHYSRFEFEYNFKNRGLKNLDISASRLSYDNHDAFMLMMHDLTEKINREKQIYLATIDAEEKERSRFSRELHDGLGPLLSTLKIFLEVYFTNPGDNEIKERIENVLSESIKSVKEISNNISPQALDTFGLTKALKSFIEKVKYSKKIEIIFESNLDERLKQESEISLYRYITELINNTLKHAQASLININIEKSQEKLYVNYQDNGKGFDINDELFNSKGIGLYNLRSRIEKLGGSIEYISSPGNGFKAKAILKI